MSLPKALKEFACTVSQCRKIITIDCDEQTEANELFDWLIEGVHELEEDNEMIDASEEAYAQVLKESGLTRSEVNDMELYHSFARLIQRHSDIAESLQKYLNERNDGDSGLNSMILKRQKTFEEIVDEFVNKADRKMITPHRPTRVAELRKLFIECAQQLPEKRNETI